MASKIVAGRLMDELTFTQRDSESRRRNWCVTNPEDWSDGYSIGVQYASEVIELALENEFAGYMAFKEAISDQEWKPGHGVEDGFLAMIASCAMADIREVEKNNAAPFDYEAAVEAAGLNA